MALLISKPHIEYSDARCANRLFALGLPLLHLRFPSASREEYKRFIEQIAPPYRDRLVLCAHYDLLQEYSLAGIYIPARQNQEMARIVETAPLKPWHSIAVGVHSVAELEQLPIAPQYALLSPVFDSVSKKGYTANTLLQHCREALQKIPFPVFALGGITLQNQEEAKALGYADVAFLGAIWQEPLPWEAWTGVDEPVMLSVAGHDPSGGAGIEADVQTARSAGVRCFTVLSARTVQSAHTFVSAYPIPKEEILQNIRLITRQHPSISVAKVGMVTDLETLRVVVDTLKEEGVKCIIWDPIVKPTKGTTAVLSKADSALLEHVLRRIQIFTPNQEECKYWLGSCDPKDLQIIAQDKQLNILLKGGHSQGAYRLDTDQVTETVHSTSYTQDASLLVQDLLFTSQGKLYEFCVPRSRYTKHGTGCMLSSAIAASIARQRTLYRACREAQQYLSRMIEARAGLLAPLRVWSYEEKKYRLAEQMKLQYLTNTSQTQELQERCEQVLQGGGRWIQLRMKTQTTAQRVAYARMLLPLCQRYGATLIIDDDVEAVLQSKAHGVHLGITDQSPLEAREILGPQAIIGYTCHNQKELYSAHQMGVDYIGVGPFRDTTTKQVDSPVLYLDGLTRLLEFNQSQPFPLPAVVIGGVTLQDVPSIVSVGANGVAVSGAIDRAPNPSQYCKQIIETFL